MGIEIFMVDMADGTLHKPRPLSDKTPREIGQPFTLCGVLLDRVMIGAGNQIRRKIKRRCPDCFIETF